MSLLLFQGERAIGICLVRGVKYNISVYIVRQLCGQADDVNVMFNMFCRGGITACLLQCLPIKFQHKHCISCAYFTFVRCVCVCVCVCV